MKLFGLHQLLPNVRRALLQKFPLNEYSDSLQISRIISKHRYSDETSFGKLCRRSMTCETRRGVSSHPTFLANGLPPVKYLARTSMYN